MNIVITGSSRGIGLELTRLALAAGHRVLAVARDPEGSPGLRDLANDRLQTARADLATDGGPIAVAEALRGWDAVDMLFNNAGILNQGTRAADFLESFRVNSVAPFLVFEAVKPLLKKSRDPKVINVTSLMGSIADNGSGGYYAYRASKSALNMINKSLSIDNDWLTSIVVHPGWVQTDMGGAGATTPVSESAGGIFKLANQLRRTESGQFFDFRGRPLPW